jgi:hypothetical protein
MVSIVVACAAIGCSSTVEMETTIGGEQEGGAAQGGSGVGGQDGVGLGPCPDSGSCQTSSCDDGQPCDVEWECNLSQPCNVVDFVRDDYTQAVSLSAPDAAVCVLEALRDGKAGSYRWYITGESIPGQFSTSATVHVRSNRAALEAVRAQFDLYVNQSYRGPALLQDPSYFEGCLAQTAAPAIFDCLENAVRDCSL